MNNMMFFATFMFHCWRRSALSNSFCETSCQNL